MSDSGERGQRPDGHRPGGSNPGDRRPGNGGPAKGRPASSGRPPAPRGNPDRAGSGDRGRSDDRGNPEERRLWTQGGAPARGNRDAREREVPEDRDPFNIRSVRAHHEAPDIPDDVRDSDLDRVARNELKTLDKENAEGIARHLVMAARLIDTDPTLAHAHATSAARRAGRIGVVRETLAITAYAIGDYALALRELRTYRRITGRDDQLPMMVDSERGIGRPDKALELGRSVTRSSLPVPVQVELAIAMSGARLDLEQLDAALVELEIPQLDPSKAFSYSPALFSAYATVLEELGRAEEAEEWYDRADFAADAIEEAGSDAELSTMEVIEEELDEPEEHDESAVQTEDDARADD
ncbi:hypothetical protein [Glaciihabitans arcticus]|uniref:hypothetical protein n=1 Tax=Glaciihabitans arcticus TaxID=2668039 RepID=UPI001F016D17|nr:hypothetical protein [Glaciihabitans arcticus]